MNSRATFEIREKLFLRISHKYFVSLNPKLHKSMSSVIKFNFYSLIGINLRLCHLHNGITNKLRR